jgi:meiotic recombination protein DMC1
MAEEFNTAVLMVCHLRWPLGTSPMLTEKR